MILSKEIRQICINREKDLNFVKLAIADAVIRGKKEMIQKFDDLKYRLGLILIILANFC